MALEKYLELYYHNLLHSMVLDNGEKKKKKKKRTFPVQTKIYKFAELTVQPFSHNLVKCANHRNLKPFNSSYPIKH